MNVSLVRKSIQQTGRTFFGSQIPREQDFRPVCASPNHANTIRRLRENHWILTEASQIHSISRYQNFIAQSRAEFGIAQNAYVKAHLGWFSDRSVHYLASDKPVLVQLTAIERWLPTGQGFLTFKSMDKGLAGIKAINSNTVGTRVL